MHVREDEVHVPEEVRVHRAHHMSGRDGATPGRGRVLCAACTCDTHTAVPATRSAPAGDPAPRPPPMLPRCPISDT